MCHRMILTLFAHAGFKIMFISLSIMRIRIAKRLELASAPDVMTNLQPRHLKHLVLHSGGGGTDTGDGA